MQGLGDLCPPALIIKSQNRAEAEANVHLAIMMAW